MFNPIYSFSKDHCEWDHSFTEAKTILGGKGAALVDMCFSGLPVPMGWTITTEVCNKWRVLSEDDGDLATQQMNFMHPLLSESQEYYDALADNFKHDPLVSVRSGAPISMPGMMDTILNVGLTTKNIDEWKNRIGERAALDSYRRLIQMMGSTAYDIDMKLFDDELDKWKAKAGVTEDKDLEPEYLNEVVAGFRYIFYEHMGMEFPDTFQEQLDAAIRAVFDSWDNPRAIEYRKIHKISDDMGTAVTVQVMVFGNMGEDSGSGVLFSRNPSTGANIIMAEYLANAQGEDVVAGIRTPDALELHHSYPGWEGELAKLCDALEASYRDMVDVEFTVQKGELFILQSRSGKRSARAAIKIAYDMVEDGMICRDEALSRITKAQYKIARLPGIDPAFDVEPHMTGLPACPGVVTGVAVFSADAAVNCTEPCIMVTHETTPDDIAGMNKAAGILTQTGGATSHAAVVARAMDKPCVVGCTDLELQSGKYMGCNGVMFSDTSKVTIEGDTGKVWVGIDVPLIDSSDSEELKALEDWCMEAGGYCEMSLMNPEDPEAEALILVHEWWGDDELLVTVLDEIAELPDRTKLTLDLRTSYLLAPDEDQDLLVAFNNQMEVEHDLMREVIEYLDARQDLKGLGVKLPDGFHDISHMLRKRGYRVAQAPTTIADLMQAEAQEPSPEFIEKLVGGDEAWVKLRKALKDAGFAMNMPKRAVPREYAVFQQLIETA